MSDEFWEIAKQHSSNKKPIKNGFLLKSEFCKKHKISLVDFEKMLIKHGYKTKCGTTIGNKFIKKRSGSWQKGVYQYQEKHFAELFEIINF